MLSPKGVLPFPPEGPIAMEFLAGRYHSGAGFTLRGRQVACGKESAAPKDSPAEPLVLREVSKEPYASDDTDLVLPWVGPGGRDRPGLSHERRGWTSVIG